MPEQKTLKLIAGGALGGLIACTLCWLACYLLIKTNTGFFGAETVTAGPVAISKAVVSSYMIQLVPVSGAGKIADGDSVAQVVSAQLALPVTIWTLLPIACILAGIFISIKTSGAADRRQRVTAALLAALAYAIIMTLVSGFVGAPIESMPIPEIGGTSVSPPAVAFSANAGSVLFRCGYLGLLCCWGFWAFNKENRNENASRQHWPASASAVIGVTLVVLLFLTGVLWQATRQKASGAAGFIELAPAAAVAAYTGYMGADISAKAESKMALGGGDTTLLSLKANAYRQLSLEADGKKQLLNVPAGGKVVAALLAAMLGLLSGLFAVRKGSTDGILLTSIRVLIFQIIMLAAVLQACELVLVSTSTAGELSTTMSVITSASFAWPVIFALFMFIAGSMLGAILGRKGFQRSFDIHNR